MGLVGAFERKVVVGDRTLTAGLLGGFIVEKSHRTFFPALMLQRAVLTWAKKNVDFAYGFPNESSAPIMKKLGFHELVTLKRWVLVVKHARYIERYVPSPHLARLLAAPIDRFRRLERRPTRGREFRAFDSIDDRFSFAPFRAPHGVRNARFVKWRFADRPDQESTVYGLSEGERLIGYVVVHLEGSTAHVRDLQGIDAQAMGDTLRHLSRTLKNAVSISFLCSAPPALATELEAIGFQVREPSRTLIGYAEDPTILESLASWYATEADEDQ